MTFRQSALAVSVVVLGILPAIGCGSNGQGLTTAPTSVPTATAAAASVVTGARAITTAAASNAITTIVAGTSCPALQFTISMYTFRTDAATAYSGGTCASLRAGTVISLTIAGSTADSTRPFYASQIAIVSGGATPTVPPAPAPTPAPTPTAVQTDGLVTSVVSGSACPDLQFMFGTYLFKITPATQYSQAGCADVKVGVHVYVSGTRRETDGFILVTGLGIKRDTAPPPAPAPTPGPGTPPAGPTAPAPAPAPVPFETTVTVSSVLAGSACPYREFMVGSYRLTTSALTRYENGSCADIAPGATLGIVATTGNRDTAVLVSSITIRRQTEPEPASDGVVADVTVSVSGLVAGTTCPALSFVVGPYTVITTSSTTYVGGMCTDIQPGTVLQLRGAKEGDDRVLAARVSFPD